MFVIYSEASDWEAKFYQIQSKYLLLLNELHNPQVGVSASRQEMVSQLLKDVIEAAETRSGPLASIKNDTENGISKSKNVSYDRFGFRIDTGTSTDSMEEKVEKLRKQAENQHQNQTAEKEEIAQVCTTTNIRYNQCQLLKLIYLRQCSFNYWILSIYSLRIARANGMRQLLLSTPRPHSQ